MLDSMKLVPKDKYKKIAQLSEMYD